MMPISSYLPSIVLLGILAFASLILTAMRPHLRPDIRTSRRFALVVALTILAQSIHFVEELLSQFPVRFPEAFGSPPMSSTFFVALNVVWLLTWVAALIAVRHGFVAGIWPLWFLGLAMVLNFVGHPILALRFGGYFPGVFTALPVGVLGLLLLIELRRVTAS
jgi:hypothetical protein